MNSSTAWLALQSLEGGIQLTTAHAADADRLAGEWMELLDNWALKSAVQTMVVPLQAMQKTEGNQPGPTAPTSPTSPNPAISDTPSVALICNLRPEFRQRCMPGYNSLTLHERLGHGPQTDPNWALEREIWVALLGSPHRFQFADLASLNSHIRVRRNMALAARKTALAFKTEAAERPQAFWQDGGDEAGFILQPGRCLVAALTAATQPDASGKLYDFSCYRATEYVILLGIAQELQTQHPELLGQLQDLNQVHAVRSAQFHEVYLVEYGSMDSPLPSHFYVPGDRLWFRNPDERSSDVTGYEGSWVMYMGGGLFSNFWKRDTPFTLESKAIEIFHWKDGVYTDAQGTLQMNETLVEALVAQTQARPEARAQVLERMLRMRDPKGVYAEGGCIDTTREYPKSVSREHCDLVLPRP